MQLIQVAVGVIIGSEQQVLMTQRPDDKDYAGFWEFPGGKIEAGESPYQALCREFKEEVAITVDSAKPLITLQHQYINYAVELHVLVVSQYSGELKPLENQAMQWVALAEIDTVRVLEANHKIIQALKACSTSS
ncbi:MAG: 8-oxo-dGTP diphosphatase MutT [Coxiellaceae bacterium]|nr:8-oxo-dGTP diphosphatase MutT [Coxiellaceae bacterium]